MYYTLFTHCELAHVRVTITTFKRFHLLENDPNLSFKNEYNHQTNEKNNRIITKKRYFSESAENAARIQSQSQLI